MDSQQRDEIKKFILEELEQTRENIGSLEELVQPIAPDNAIGRLSRMEAIGAKSINEASLNKARLKLEKLKNVLAAIDEDPDYGLCLECGEDIPTGRIKLIPESRLCVTCASSHE